MSQQRSDSTEKLNLSHLPPITAVFANLDERGHAVPHSVAERENGHTGHSAHRSDRLDQTVRFSGTLNDRLNFQQAANAVLRETTRRFVLPTLSESEMRALDAAYDARVSPREFGLELAVRDLVQRVSDLSGAIA